MAVFSLYKERLLCKMIKRKRKYNEYKIIKMEN